MVALMCVVGTMNAALETFDTYPGGGTGWSGNWTTSGANTVAWSDASPLTADSGGYLTYRTDPTATANANGIGRDFAGVIGSAAYTLTVTVRVDSLGTFYQGNSLTNDRLQIRADVGSGTNDAGANSAWLIMASPNFLGAAKTNWHVYDGSVASSLHGFARVNFVDSGIAVVEGGVYTFTIKVDPTTRLYDTTITDGTNVGVVNGAEFRATSSAPADLLVFSNKLRVVPTSGLVNSTSVQLSYDSIQIVPEPATLTLLGFGALVALYRRKKLEIAGN